MLLIPAFEVGLWNGWIFVLTYLLMLYGLSFLVIRKKAALFIWTPYDKGQKRLLRVLLTAYFALWIYSMFLPLKLGTAWFYAGFLTYLLGMFFVTVATLDFTTAPSGKPVTKGLFRISRHPICFGFFLIIVGTGIGCTSWIFLLMAIFPMVLHCILATPEEHFHLEKYGSAYREYMNETPKWIGIPRSTKSD